MTTYPGVLSTAKAGGAKNSFHAHTTAVLASLTP